MANKEKRKRPITRKVRFNEKENDYITQKVEDSPFNSFQNFARSLLIMGEVNYYDYSELKSLVSEVNMIGHNINQLVKLAHQFEEVSAEDISDVKRELHRLQVMVDKQFSQEIAKERRG